MLLKNLMFMLSPTAEGGVGTSQDESGKQKDDKQDEANVTLTKEELANRYQNKFAEGAKKAQKALLDELGISSVEELKAKLGADNSQEKGTKSEDVEIMKKEIATLKALNTCNELNVRREFQEDVIALIKGKGQEVTQDNIQKVVERHPEWVVKSQEDIAGVKKLGGTDGENKPPKPDEKEQAKALFGLK